MEENEIGTKIVEGAIAVHRELGPGLLESAYEAVLAVELRDRGLSIARQVMIPLFYKGIKIEKAFKADMIINHKVLVELKSVEKVTETHKKQALTYLYTANLKLCYLLNFGEPLMRSGITRLVNGL